MVINGQKSSEKQDVYKFTHFRYGIETLTLYDMSKKYNLSKGTLSLVIQGQRAHHKGWQMFDTVGNSPINYEKESTTYKFWHTNYGIIECSRKELSNRFSLTMGKLKGLVDETSQEVKGWRLSKNKDKDLIKGQNSILRKFKHKDGKIFIGSTSDLVALINGSSGSMTQVVKGKRKSHKGWEFLSEVTN